MSERAERCMTPAEFFDWQAIEDRNYELVDGIPVVTIKAMTGATARHGHGQCARVSRQPIAPQAVPTADPGPGGSFAERPRPPAGFARRLRQPSADCDGDR